MSLPFVIIAALTIAAAVAAMSLRNLVHCALALALTFAGLAALYLQLGAQFVGFAQILVYVGAVAILIVFAILLTRSSEPTTQPVFSSSWLIGIVVGALVLGTLVACIRSSSVARRGTPPAGCRFHFSSIRALRSGASAPWIRLRAQTLSRRAFVRLVRDRAKTPVRKSL